MKVAVLLMVGALLATMGGCQSSMSSGSPPPVSNPALTASSGDPYPDVPVGDAYFEEMIGRYQLPSK